MRKLNSRPSVEFWFRESEGVKEKMDGLSRIRWVVVFVVSTSGLYRTVLAVWTQDYDRTGSWSVSTEPVQKETQSQQKRPLLLFLWMDEWTVSTTFHNDSKGLGGCILEFSWNRVGDLDTNLRSVRSTNCLRLNPYRPLFLYLTMEKT